MKQFGRLLLPVFLICIFGCEDKHEDKKYIDSLTKDSRIAEIDLVDDALERCITRNSEQNGWETLEDITYLICSDENTCKFNEAGEVIWGTCKISSIEALTAMPNLEYLSLGNNFESWEDGNEPLKVIAQIPSLTKLSITYIYSDDKVLETGANLKTLEILDGAEHIKFTAHPSVETLVLKADDDYDLSEEGYGNSPYELYSHFPNLKSLTIDSANMDAFKIASKMTGLQSLTIEDGVAKDISQIKDLTNLHTLIAEYGQIESLEGIENLSSLVILDLYKNLIVDVSPISHLKRLKYLNLSYNAIEIIDGFSELDNVTDLYVEYNNLSNINELVEMESLKILGLGENEEINDFTPLLEMESIETLKCSWDFYSEIDDDLINKLNNKGC